MSTSPQKRSTSTGYIKPRLMKTDAAHRSCEYRKPINPKKQELSLSPEEKSFTLKSINKMLVEYKDEGKRTSSNHHSTDNLLKSKQRIALRRKSANAHVVGKSPRKGISTRGLSPVLDNHPRNKSKNKIENHKRNAIYTAISDKVQVLQAMGNKLFEKNSKLKLFKRELTTREKDLEKRENQY